MEKILLVYFSGGGNTKAMADAIFKGLTKNHEVSVDRFQVGMIRPDRLQDYDKVLLGCPASGIESLEPEVFEPFYVASIPYLKNKPIALFGSYGLGVGRWMKKWENRVKQDGAILFEEGFICLQSPEGEIIDDLIAFGHRFSKFTP